MMPTLSRQSEPRPTSARGRRGRGRGESAPLYRARQTVEDASDLLHKFVQQAFALGTHFRAALAANVRRVEPPQQTLDALHRRCGNDSRVSETFRVYYPTV